MSKLVNKNSKFDILIVGAGIIGSAIAREFSKYDKKILVLEANPFVGLETTTGNSGVVHCGFDANPKKLNAKLNILGRKRYQDWIKEMDFPWVKIPSLVISLKKEENEHLEELYKQGIINGVSKDEISILTKEEALKKEPSLSKNVQGALYCNASLAIDAPELTRTLIENAVKNGVTLKTNSKVVKIKKNNSLFEVTTSDKKTYKTKFIINAAGHYADQIAKMANCLDFSLNTLRGEYRVLDRSQGNVVKNIVFKVPTIYGKGVIVAPRLDGTLLVGPTAEKDVPKEETRVITTKMYKKVAKIGKTIVPTLDFKRTVLSFSGSRSIDAEKNDFHIKAYEKDNHFINVAGIKSPGLSAAPAIADYVIDIVKTIEGANLGLNKKYNPNQKKYNKFNE